MFLKSYYIYIYLESPKPLTTKTLEKQKKQSQKSWGCLGNQKNKKKQNFEENLWFWLKRLFFCWFSLGFCVCSGFKRQNPKKTWVFWLFAYILSTNTSKKQKNSSCFDFWYVSMQKTKPKMLKKQKKKLEFFLFFEILIDHIQEKNVLFVFPFQNKKKLGKQKKLFWVKIKHSLTFSQKFCFFGFARALCFFWFVYCFIWFPSVSLWMRTLSVLGSLTLIKVSHSRACALCETKLGIGCAVMFMHLKISCCSAFLLYCLSLATFVQILESWNLGFVHTYPCPGLTYSNKAYRYKYLENTFGYLGGNGGVFLWEHVILLCNRML